MSDAPAMERGGPSGSWHAVRRLRWPLVLCALALAVVGLNMTAMFRTVGDTGVTLVPSETPFVERIAAIDPRSPAERAGLRVGDTLDLRELPPEDRIRLALTLSAAAFPSHTSVTLPFRRNAHRLAVTLAPQAYTAGAGWASDGWDLLVGFVGSFWSLGLAALIVWRRRQTFEAQLLALCLILIKLGISLRGNSYWMTPWPGLDAALDVSGAGAFSIGFVLLATYALQFGRPVSTPRRILTAAAFATAAVYTVTQAIAIGGEWLGSVDEYTWFFGAAPVVIVQFVLLAGLPLCCAALAARAARDGDRTRVTWASGSLAVLYVAFIAFTTSSVLGVGDPVIAGTTVHLGTIVINTSLFIAPLGLTYALLNQHLLGAGFVMSRATVAAVLSAGAIAAFALMEWVLPVMFVSLGTAGVLAINIVAAIALGLAAPAMYRRSEALVERVFFARQTLSRAQAARLISGLPYVDAPATIARVLTRDLCGFLNLASGAVFRRDPEGPYRLEAHVGWNEGEPLTAAEIDRVVLQLSADRSPLALADVPSGAAFVLPLEARRELVGFVVYSIHEDGVAIEPDERELLLDGARQASRGYDALELASRVERAFEARMDAEAEARETLRRSHALLERISAAQARFIPSEFLRILHRDSIVDLELGDSTLKTMTVLFSDIRSFTTISESMAPPDIFAFLNA